MRWLVTAGGTHVPIDQVREIATSFSGRTGATIALAAHRRGHDVTLLTSNPGALAAEAARGISTRTFRTFDELQLLMAETIGSGAFDCVVHSAAVSDFRCTGVYGPAAGTSFEPATRRWSGNPPEMIDRAAPKVRSDEPEIWLRLTKTPKLVDLVRSAWSFRGVLVKFKLEVGLDHARLLEIAERSRQQSRADLMVANTLEGVTECAFVGPIDGQYRRVTRTALPAALVDAVESCNPEGGHG